jgi:hypothetical protein
MGGAVVNTRQYVAVEIDQFSNILDVLGLKKKQTTPVKSASLLIA